MSEQRQDAGSPEAPTAFGVTSGADRLNSILFSDGPDESREASGDEEIESAEHEPQDEPEESADDDEVVEDGGDEEPVEEGLDEPDDEEDDEDLDEPSDSDLPQTVTVKVDGEETEVSLDEAIAGYQRQQAFTRKTQELAEQRKAMQAESEEIRTVRTTYEQRLSELEETLDALMPDDSAIESLREQDPQKFAAAHAELERRRKIVEAVKTERERVQEEQSKTIQEAQQAILAEEREKLHLAVPEWQDEDRAAADKAKLAEYAEKSYGFTQDELVRVQDHRAIVLLRKAMLYDQAQEKGRSAPKKRKRAPTLKPGKPAGDKKAQRSKKKRASAVKKLQETGKLTDAADVIEKFFLPGDK